MKISRLVLVCLCASRALSLSADQVSNADSSQAADLARQADAKLQEASSPQDFRAAAALLEKSLKLNPQNLDARQTLGWIYLDQLHDPQKAYPHLEILARNRPDDVDARKLFGMACNQTGHSQQAVDEFRAAAKLQPNDLWIRANLARALARTGKRSEAEAMDNEILKADPTNADARLGLAEIEAWSGQNARPLQTLDQLIKENPDNTEALTMRGDLRRWNWDLTGAQQDYQQVLEYNQNDYNALTGLHEAENSGASDVTLTGYEFRDTTGFRRVYLEADGRGHLTDSAYLIADLAGWRFANPGFSDLNRGDASAGLEYHFTRWLEASAEADVYDYEHRSAFYGGHFYTKITPLPGTDIYITGALHQPYIMSILTVESGMRQDILGLGLDTKLPGRFSFQTQAQGASLSDENSWWEVTPQLSYRLIDKLQTFVRVQYDYLNYSETRTNYWTPQHRNTLGPVLDTSIPILKNLHLEGDFKAPFVFQESRFGYEVQVGPVLDLFNHVQAKVTYYYSHVPGDEGEWSGEGWQGSLQVKF